MNGRRTLSVITLLIGFAAARPVVAAEPEIRNLSLRGLQIKGLTTLTIDGDGLGTNPRLLLPFAAKATLKPGGNDKQATFDIALAEDVAPGYYLLRAVNENGISLPAVIAVDRLPQKQIAPILEQLPAAFHGTLTGSTVVEASLAGKSGQKITIEVEAQRLGGKLRPVLHLYSPKRLQLAWTWGTPSLHGDCRLEATLPEDGNYRLVLHDGEYQGQAPGHYRLRVGNWSYVDQVFPPVVGKETSVELLGSQAGQLEVPTTRKGRWLPLAWPKEGTWSGPRPYVEISSRTELLEKPSSAKPQELPGGSIGVCGRLAVPFEEDRYRLPVTPGAKIRFEVFAERLGSPIDASLVIRNDMGAELARVEDGPGTLDPMIEYTAPANVNALVVGIVDSQGRGGPRGIYRLIIDPATAAAVQNEFALVSPTPRISLPADGRIVLPIWVERRGYLGGIDLTAAGLPPGMKLDGLKIPPGGEGALVSLLGSGAPVNPATFAWQGRADDGREHSVIQKNHPMDRLQPWLASEFAIAGTPPKGSAFQIDWITPKGDEAIVVGRRWAPKVKATQPLPPKKDPNPPKKEPAKKEPAPPTKEPPTPPGPVRLTLLTSQLPVLVNGQPDPNRTIRLEKPIELAAESPDGEVPIFIPLELPGTMYDVAIQAEFLSADKRAVVATVYSPVRRLPVRLPIALKLGGPNRIDVKLDPKKGATFEIAGTIERMPGAAGDVQVSLTGLPGGAQAPPVTVKDQDSPFRLKVTLPANVPAGEIKNLKISGSFLPDAKQPNQRVRGKDVELTLNIVTAK